MTRTLTPPPPPEGFARDELPTFTMHEDVIVACAPRGMQREVVISIARHMITVRDEENTRIPWIVCDDDPDLTPCGCASDANRFHFFLKDESKTHVPATDGDEDEDHGSEERR